jgi:TRAP-type C4-dicarboxylate transport system permease small subunit
MVVPPISLADRADRLGRNLETLLLSLTVGGMIGLAAVQILLRNFWGGGIAWADEVLRILVLWAAMLGAVAASREQRHVSIDALSRYLPAFLHRFTVRLTSLFTAVVCFILAWYSWLFVADSWDVGDRVLGGEMPAWAVQAILPVGFALIGYRYVIFSLRRQPISVSRGARK